MTTSWAIWARAAVLVVLLGCGVAVAWTTDLPSPTDVRALVEGAGAAGRAVAVGAVALVLLAPVPRSAVSVLVGVVAGFWTGLGIAYAGGLLAALGAFALSRALGRAVVQRLAGPRASRVDTAVTDRAFLAVLAARLLPVVPFAATNYAMGLSGVPVRPYLAATAIGMLPSTLVQVGLGASAGVLVDLGTPVLAVLAAVVVVGVAAMSVGLWRRRRAVPA